MATVALSILSVLIGVALSIFNPITLLSTAWGIDWGNHNRQVQTEVAGPSLILVGDIQLGRDVERKIISYGEAYPYTRIHDVLQAATYVVGNFEGAIPEVHAPTPDYKVSFSVDRARLAALKEAGITHASLANNHSYDKGVAGYNHTKEELANAGIIPLQMPTEAEMSTSRITLGELELSLIVLDTVDATADLDILKSVIEAESQVTDQQLVYIHWGTEYIPVHNRQQAELAHWLVDQGVDIIVGHHPHVVQDVEEYKGALIVYSLGNFIFDQYFSPEVQTGLMVKLSYTDHLKLQLIPVTSRDMAASPRLMNEAEQQVFFKGLWARSNVVPETLFAGGSGVFDSLAIWP